MRFDVTYETAGKTLNLPVKRLGKLADKFFALSTKAEVNVFVVTPSRMKALNMKASGRRKETDVLSFPLHARRPFVKDADGRLRLGDIFICKAVAKKSAEEKGVAAEEEAVFLLVHGLLHLLGFDHAAKDQKEKMDRMSRKIILKLKSK